MTYYPNSEVQALLANDPNAETRAIRGIIEKRQAIRDELDKTIRENENSDNAISKGEESVTSTQEARKNYLQSLPVTQ